MLTIFFLEDLIGEDLSEYVLIDCYYLIATALNNVWILLINSNGLPLYSKSRNAMEFVMRICSYYPAVANADEVWVKKKLALINKCNNLGFLLSRDSSKIEVHNQAKVLEMLEKTEDPFRWEMVQNL